ncbi:plant cysteine oxidase 1-like [Aristolochia californica]|uniref:plant cysteine oxidase 1-like n=1 Tax=Aristolochia californica TaxID=171875 RepID=UPI0035D7EC19
MRIERAALIEKREQEVRELPKENNHRSKKNKRRHKKSMSSVVQKLFDTCKEVFAHGGAGIIPSEMDVERIKSVLDSMSPSDVGLNEEMPFFKTLETEGAPPITYLHLYECDKFSMGIFCLPPRAVIPLHNHPGMTVFSKILLGSMHIRSFDWTDIPQNTSDQLNPTHFQPAGVRLAELKKNTVFTAPCDTSLLYPAAGGNLHRFTAVTACAVLDVLGPPYCDSEGRHCAYYQEFPYASFSGDDSVAPVDSERYAWLEEKDNPDNLFVVGAPYLGPRITETE